MKRIAYVIAALALGLALPGCVFVSGQVRIPYELPTFTVSTASTITAQPIDLSTEKEWVENREKLQGLSDVAVLGKFTNEGDADIGVVVWMTPGTTNYTTVDELKADATKIKLWGAFKVKAGSSVIVDWDESARLFTKDGRAALVTETKGDGMFTLYAIAEQDTYTFRVESGTLVLVVDTTWDKLW